MRIVIKWIYHQLFCSKCKFENDFVVKEWKLNVLNKHELVEGNVALIYICFTDDSYFRLSLSLSLVIKN